MTWEPRIERQYAPDGTLLHEKIQYTPDGEWQDLKQQPVAWMQNDMEHFSLWPDEWHVVPLYTAPPQRKEWQGLTDDEIAQLMVRCDVIVTGPTQFNFANAIEAKLKEKNT
jgi:hypothetical protein